MQFCLRTGFDESKDFYGGTEETPYAGLGQGSGTAPPVVSALSTLIVNAYKQMGNGAKMTSTYTCRMFFLVTVMQVDDTDFLHLGLSPTIEPEEFIEDVQRQSDDYGQLSQASCGILKPEKCSLYLMLYKFD